MSTDVNVMKQEFAAFKDALAQNKITLAKHQAGLEAAKKRREECMIKLKEKFGISSEEGLDKAIKELSERSEQVVAAVRRLMGR